MIPENLQEAGRDFQRSIARNDFRDLDRRLSELRTMVSEQLASLPASDPSRLELISWGLALTGWGNKMISTQRQKWADEKQPLDLIEGYSKRPASPRRRICVDL